LVKLATELIDSIGRFCRLRADQKNDTYFPVSGHWLQLMASGFNMHSDKEMR
jgi:hypothetical protein